MTHPAVLPAVPPTAVLPAAVLPAAERADVRAQLDELLGDRTDREAALVAHLVGGFRQKAADLLDLADRADAEADAASVARHLHTLKGAAALLGAVELPLTCQAVEDAAAATSGGERRRRLEPVIARFCAVLAEEAGRLTGEPPAG